MFHLPGMPHSSMSLIGSKSAIPSVTTLHYFDASQPNTVQMDPPQTVLDAAILQNDESVAYKRKAFTATECRYTNIGRDS